MTKEPTRPVIEDIGGAAAVLAMLGDSVTTDHISPAGNDQGRPARPDRYLIANRACQAAATSTPTAPRRGNDDVMTRGTFANVRLKQRDGPGHRGRR